jgi:hypothetical protein
VDNGQAMQQELLEQLKNTVGEDAMNAVASTSADANKLFNDGIELATQQYNQSNMTKFITDSVGNFNPLFPPLPFGTPFPTLFSTSESSNAASAAQSITQDPTSTSTSTLASTQEPPQDDLTAQFMSIAYQATGLSAAGLSQLLSVGDTVNEFHLMATDISKGLTPEFIKREKELFAAILDGKAIEDHLEPSYFKAISKAVLSALDIQDSEEDEKKDA